ncbi:MAG: hypothetical protein N2037_09520 [Acidimicrobiales bacterium]|nr:hypothetical protein [Acidimicrobiales bacterium]
MVVGVRGRLQRFPNSALLALALVVFVGSAVLGTLPYDVVRPDGFHECGPPLFELVVDGRHEGTPVDEACRDGAVMRVGWGAGGAATAIVIGVIARQIRKRRYDRLLYDWG